MYDQDGGARALGQPIASGRSADLYDLGDGTVLRRIRDHDVRPAEVAAMRRAEAARFPVPHVYAVDGRDLVVDRVEGCDMLALIGARPWRVVRFGRILAELHLQLRAITPAAELPGDEPRTALVHGDLHPGNILMSPDGPVVIDWENASAGPADLDVATTWLILAIGEPDGASRGKLLLVRVVRRILIRTFLAGTGRPSRSSIARACASRLDDRNLRPHELACVREFAARYGSG